MKFFQAKTELNGVSYEGPCCTGETFAIRALIEFIALETGVCFHYTAVALKGKVAVSEI